ncbi:hypothetical protein BJV82DRAFT_584145 [Fennellomyces sp. T-0311]|nr:hypothetical protein BJV82DRAFT_584145 [Fennellomyces sp. T-0311]
MTNSIPKTSSPKDPNNDSSDTKSLTLSAQQFGFLTILPSDILLGIFMHLKQRDSLACMAVCRDWYHTIPQYTQSAWETLTLGARDVKMENKRRICCLGDHVKHVILVGLKSEDIYHTVEKLLTHGCARIESLELNGCQTDDQDGLLEILTKLAPHLTHLKFVGHRSNIAFSHIFTACPELTHFTYQLKVDDWEGSGVYDTEPTIQKSKEPTLVNRPTKITHLCLDVVMNKDTRLYPLLRRCPNLRCFIGPSLYARFDNSETWQYEWVWDCNPVVDGEPWWDYNRISVDIDFLLKMCPNINYLQPYYTYQDFDELGDVDGYTNDTNCTGLRYLSICEDYGGARVARYVTRNQSTLENLFIQPIVREDFDLMYQWSPVFQSLQLPQLRTLHLDITHRDTASLISLLNHCPALEGLYIFSGQLVFDPQTLGSLTKLQRLRSLTCPYLHIDGLCLMMLLDCCPRLEELSLGSPFIPFNIPRYPFNGLNELKHLHISHIEWTDAGDVSDKDEAFASVFQHITANSKLETLSMSWVQHFGPKVLLKVAEISTLKICRLHLDQAHYHSDILREFVEKRPGIQVLAFQSHGDLPSGVLTALSKVPSLKELFVSAYGNNSDTPCAFDGSDMLQLLNNSKLTGIYFQNLVVGKSEQTPCHMDISDLIDQEAPQYYVLNDSKQPNVPFETKPHMVTYATVIKRRNK